MLYRPALRYFVFRGVLDHYRCISSFRLLMRVTFPIRYSVNKSGKVSRLISDISRAPLSRFALSFCLRNSPFCLLFLRGFIHHLLTQTLIQTCCICPIMPGYHIFSRRNQQTLALSHAFPKPTVLIVSRSIIARVASRSASS